MDINVIEEVTGFRTQDGAGVSLVRVLSNRTVDAYDPLLMLDSFDSEDPDDYIKGFPLHPHRGIETVSLIVKGNMMHKDSLGNEDHISDGEVQWMTAGSGILHEENLPASERMLGIQLWLNLPKKDKMCSPEYHSIKRDQIPEVEIENGILRVVSGNYKDIKGYQPKYQPLNFYHIILEPNGEFELETKDGQSATVFTLLGSPNIGNKQVVEKTAAKLSEGKKLRMKAQNEETHILYIGSERLNEPIAWGGPIVMNTKEEVNKAFEELSNGNFLKEEAKYD